MLPVVVMGVSGVGKSTLGRALADALGWRFVEGDTLHPAENVRKMAAGMPLDDHDRQPFLERVAAAITAGRQGGVVISCSALKRRYRELIREQAGEVMFVLPVLDRDAIVQRLARRSDHFMPVALLDSQLQALELPDPDEPAVLVDGRLSPALQVSQVMAGLQVAGVSARVP